MNVSGGGAGIPGPGGGKIAPGTTGVPGSLVNPAHAQPSPYTCPTHPHSDSAHPQRNQYPYSSGYHDPTGAPNNNHVHPTFHDVDPSLPGPGGPAGYGGGGGGVHGAPIYPGSLEDKLRVAASKGQVDKVPELLQAGAGFKPDRENRTALHYAAQNGHADVCKLLIEKGCELDIQDTMGCTALLRASSQGLLDVVRVLLEGGCAVDFADEYGSTALHEAAWHGFSKTVELLIKYNANVFRTNKSGFTALHLAAQNGHNESTRVLLYGGINPDLQNNYGDTALHTAARYGHAGVTRILFSAKCQLNVQNKNGDTALHIAAALKRRKIAKILVESHIDVHVKNKQNETAVDVARRKEHPEIIIIITSLKRLDSTGPKGMREIPGVSFKDEIEIDGPVVCADDEPPIKPEKERRFFQFFKKKKKEKDKEKETKASQLTSSQGKKPVPPGKVQPVPSRPVAGFFSQYVPTHGTQYYRDLAGNIKQGPVGYIPVCQCQPALHHIEKTMHSTKEQLYDHIDASHQVLSDRLAQLDIRASQQVHALDHLTRERLVQEREECKQAIESRLQRERHHTQYVVETYGDDLQGHIHNWLEDRLASYGHCLDHHHDDLALPPRHIFTDVNIGPDGGRLFRSRSDETLSVSDYSGKGRKREFYASRKAAMEQIRGWKVPGADTAGPGGPPSGLKVTGRRAERERGRSTDNIGGRDGRESRGPSQNAGAGAEQGRGHLQRTVGVAGIRAAAPSTSTGNMILTAAEVHKPRLDDRLADGASPTRLEGDSPLSRPNRHVAFGTTAAYQSVQPSQGAIPKRSVSTLFHTHAHPENRHFQGQPPQARSHGNLTSQQPPGTAGSFGPSHTASSPRRGILRSKTDEGTLHERAMASSRSLHSPRTPQPSQPNLDGRGPLGENTGLNPSGQHHPRGDPFSEAMTTPATGRLPGVYGVAAALSNTSGRVVASGGVPSASNNYHYQHNPSYGTAQSAGDLVKQFHAVDSDAQRSRPRTRSTDTVLDISGDGGSSKFRSRSEERALDSADSGARPSTSAHADYSGYVTDSGMRPSCHDNSNQRYGYSYGGSAVSYGPALAGINSPYGARPESRERSRADPPDRRGDQFDPGLGERRPSLNHSRSGTTEYNQTDRPSSGGQRQSGYHTDTDLRQGVSGDYFQRNGSSVQRPQDQQPSSHQATARYRVLPPLPPNAASDRTYPKVPPKPTLSANPVLGQQAVYQQTRPPSAGNPTAYDRSCSPSAGNNHFSYDGSPAAGNQTVFDRSRSQTPTGKDSSLVMIGQSGFPGRGFSQGPQGASGQWYSESSGINCGISSGVNNSINSGVNSSINSGVNNSINSGVNSSINSGVNSSINSGLQQSSLSGYHHSGALPPRAELGGQSSLQDSKLLTKTITESPRDGQRDKPSSLRGSSVGQQHTRTPSPYQSGGLKPSFSKSETNIVAKSSDRVSARTDTPPQPAVPSGHYSVTNGCLQHDTYTYSPTAYVNNGGSKEDSTCSSNQDSGYSGRMPAGRGSGGDSTTNTPSSSFSTDRSLSLGTPGNSHAGSPYMHIGEGGRDGNPYGDYVPMGSTSSGGSIPQEDFRRSTARPPPPPPSQPRGENGSFKGYPQSSKLNVPPAVSPSNFPRTTGAGGGLSQSDYPPSSNLNAPPVLSQSSFPRTTGGGVGLMQSDYQKLSFKNVPSDYQSANSQQQQRPGTTPGLNGSHGNEGNNASDYGSGTGHYGNNPGNTGTIQKQVQGWYQQKLMEAAQRLRNNSQYTQQNTENVGLQDGAVYSGGYDSTPFTFHYDPVLGSDV